VVLGTLGRREAELGGGTRLSEPEGPVVRRQALTIVAQAVLIAVVGAAIVWGL